MGPRAVTEIQPGRMMSIDAVTRNQPREDDEPTHKDREPVGDDDEHRHRDK